MNAIEATATVVRLHGEETMVTRQAPGQPVDELSCDECHRPVGLTTTNVGTAEDPVIRIDFRPYFITRPYDVVVIFCQQDADK